MSRFEAQDQLNNPAPETTDFERIVSNGLNRRQFIGGAAIAGLSAMTMGCSSLNAASASTPNTQKSLIGFKAVPASSLDTIVVPEGYRWDLLVSWGEPLFSNVEPFKDGGMGSAEAQALQFGDNNDGMSFFPISEDHAIMAINNEYTNYEYLFPHQGKEMTASDVRKAQAAHGVSIIEVQRKDNRWYLVKDSKYNRRIHANTPMELTGPAAGHPLMQTSADPQGKRALGTFNNCANGQTPWGTYLTCEENFNGYFGSSETLNLSPETKRYGIKTKDAGYQWHAFDERFDLAKNPQEPHRFGWVVEIDPMNPNAMPKKRTALGRFKHENAALTINNDGHVVVYLGDDERGEHLYKFVSKQRYTPGNTAANLDLLEEGTLYVARFSSEIGKVSGRGEWLELSFGKNGLTPENGFNSQAEVMIFARKAATILGATTMDRPEWVAVHPSGKQVFCTLTNNKNRGKDRQPVGGPNPRAKNNYGQIVRWQPDQQDHTQTGFSWDLFVMAGNPEVHAGTAYAGSANINSENMFNSPDGLGFDADGRLWIQTDGKYSNKGDFSGMGNNQMLCADPTSGEIRRFLTGPIACEITGLAFSPDYKTLFIGIQHPGEELEPSHFPQGGNHTPRSSVIAIQKEDGGIIGS
ncbi:hypothetical protein SAMN02745127_03080 [Oceanospirillum multiglobuliferum]|uniref:Transcriptional initiation protein Tat n=1 Tax=Oceanospirillum multiglobuliferum TaxID=64969 RepID=A0A1T4SHA4_9GAMM|nr:PhoX family phosphatase [Oceanospirillum multiglobuliferum]OPX54226.1 transcriptional initiation protein Tat [Oceanospirillum multiglobuliferum]SKA27674.1 hypothetical protein SAMN02745127_03080 [Oceanospirillum multiglobuliferum]